jgi:hypothetical protein
MKAFKPLDNSTIQQEGSLRSPPVFTVSRTLHTCPIWPDVSVIGYSHSTHDESVYEVLEELKTLSLKDLSLFDMCAEFTTTHNPSFDQFERAGSRGSHYSQVLRLAKAHHTGMGPFK